MATLRTTANGKTRLDNSPVRFRAAHIDFGVEAYFDADKLAPEHPFGALTQSTYNLSQQRVSALLAAGTILLPELAKLTSCDSGGSGGNAGHIWGRHNRRMLDE